MQGHRNPRTPHSLREWALLAHKSLFAEGPDATPGREKDWAHGLLRRPRGGLLRTPEGLLWAEDQDGGIRVLRPARVKPAPAKNSTLTEMKVGERWKEKRLMCM